MNINYILTQSFIVRSLFSASVVNVLVYKRGSFKEQILTCDSRKNLDATTGRQKFPML